MLMGHSVEGRFPYLDHRVAEFAAALPDRYRLAGLSEKHVLRRAAAGLVPDPIRLRRKHPFRAPIGPVLAGPAPPEYVGELLSSRSLERAGLFQREAVERLLTKARRHDGRDLTETEEMALVGVVSTMLLYEQYVADPPPPRSVEAQRLVTAPAEVAAGA